MTILEMSSFQGSILALRFAPIVLQIKEAGFIQHWEQTIRKNKSHQNFVTSANYKIKDETFNLYKIRPVFIILAIGIAIACVAFVCEITLYTLQQKFCIRKGSKRNQTKPSPKRRRTICPQYTKRRQTPNDR